MGEMSGTPGTMSFWQVRLGEPAQRLSIGVDEERVRHLGAFELRSHLGRRLADERKRRLPEVHVGDAHEGEPLQRAVGADEVLDERVGRRHEKLGRGRVLGELAALLEDRDAVAHLDRLVDVVGDEEDRLLHLGLEAQELVLEALAVDGVDRAERLVHQHHAGVRGERARDAHPLLLTAGELRRIAVAKLGVEADEADQLVDRAQPSAALSQPSIAGTVAMFSPIVRCGKRPICWIT